MIQKRINFNCQNIDQKTEPSYSPKMINILEQHHNFTLLGCLSNAFSEMNVSTPPLLSRQSSYLSTFPESPCKSIVDFSNFYKPKPIKLVPLSIIENSFIDLKRSKCEEANSFKASLNSGFENFYIKKSANHNIR
jgi:hypothetical protein